MRKVSRRILMTAVGGIGLLWPISAQTEDRPAVLGVSHISLQVRDLDAARGFYAGLLGYEEPFILQKADGSVERAIFKVNDRQFIEISPDLPTGQDERLAHVALQTTDAEAMRLYLREKGVSVPESVTAGKDGNRSITVKDPDGHWIDFVEHTRDSRHAGAKGKYMSAQRISDRISHVGMTVRNPEAADRFYKDILGLSEIWRGGNTAGVTNWVNMRLPESTDYIEYIIVGDKVTRSTLGSAHHICLMVPDMQKAFETLRERPGGQSLQAPRVGRNDRWLLNMFDPDGTRTELMEPYAIR